MFTVALIGADGAGKTTVARRLEKALDMPAKYIYMGLNREASNIMLPTTWVVRAVQRAIGVKQSVGPVVPGPRRWEGRKRPARAWSQVKLALRSINLICEECYREGVAWLYRRRRYVIVFDRHFYFDHFDPTAAQVDRRRPLFGRVHALMLDRVYAKPDLVICLDAPAELMLARKGEGTLEALEYWRQRYLRMRPRCGHFVVVDATQPAEDVVAEVARHVLEYSKRREGGELAKSAE